MKDKDTFVLTSNVDMLFPRNGFDEARLFTPQGDYGMEHLVHHHPDARLIRINLTDPELPEELGERAVALAMGASQAFELLGRS